MPRIKTDKSLAEVQKTTKKLKKLFGLLIDTYIKALESGEDLNASYLKEVSEFLRQNDITLSNMVNLELLDSLKHMSSDLKGNLEKNITAETEGYLDDFQDFEPFSNTEMYPKDSRDIQ